MTSSEIRQSFLDFFKSKQHTIVPSSSLLPDAPNLLFTNAGMNQFVPIFLGQRKPDVDKWPGAIVGADTVGTRVADTQKCIRAGGKHNDLEDVGLDTYHHTFFEMLGNWSFGDYFKKEAIEWGWELLARVWKFPANRLYATVYKPGAGDPSEFDQEAYGHWERLFKAAGLDPKEHIVYGNKKDNFWMMGDTGPCGPCSEIHVDLTPVGDTKGSLVNQGDARCIEIWNLVFIQFNANPDGTFTPLPARHVDTGMGFERVTSIIQGTHGFKDFAKAKISNYETDIFRPIFDALEKLSGRKYGSTLPPADLSTINPQQSTDVAFRVIADHIRTLSFAIADGIQPSNEGRGYVLRRILRRAVRYGRALGFRSTERITTGPDPVLPNTYTQFKVDAFLPKLLDALSDTMGDVFPEIRAKKKHVQEVIRTEEEAFNKTLDRGIEMFGEFIRQFNEAKEKFSVGVNLIEADLDRLKLSIEDPAAETWDDADVVFENSKHERYSTFFVKRIWRRIAALEALELGTEILRKCHFFARELRAILDSAEVGSVEHEDCSVTKVEQLKTRWRSLRDTTPQFPGSAAFSLYDTYGFPLDLTELIARERGLTVDKEGFEKLMEEQRARARAAQKKTVIEVAESIGGFGPTRFVGYDTLEFETEFGGHRGEGYFVTVSTPFYAEMGGQVGDSGLLEVENEAGEKRTFRIVNTTKTPNGVYVHMIDPAEKNLVLPSKSPDKRHKVVLRVDRPRRFAIQRHHTVTHLFHWALHEVVSKDATQKGSYVGPDKLTFDFNSGPLTTSQIGDIEKLVNERILENAGVSWTEVPYADVKSRKDVLQFFGDKYGDTVRVVQIGGKPQALDGYSMELCGGTHTHATGEIGLFRIVGESAIAAGVRRIEAVAGLEAYRKATDELHLIKTLAGKVNSPVAELEKKIEALLAHQKELEKQVKIALQRNASNAASELLGRAQTVNGIPLITHNLGDADADFLQAIADALKGRFKGVVVLGGVANNAVALVATVSPEFTAKVQAGKIIQQIAPIVGGKGGGKPDNARGGGKDASKLDEALAKAKSTLNN